LHRHTLIEDGKKIIEFKAPSEILSGDRFHEWIGARYSINRDATDFDRIYRQEILLTEIIKNKIDFSNLVNSKNYNGLNEYIINIIKSIDDTWKIKNIKYSDFLNIKVNKRDMLKLKNEKLYVNL